MPLNYSRWKHRITFALSPVTTVADRWVSFVLPWRVGINSDYSDIRFTDTNGKALSYNIASKTDQVTATVKILIPTAGTRRIHLYFGNSQAVSESTAAGTEDATPVLTAVSGTTNPGYSGKFTRVQGGRLNQQRYTASRVSGPYPKHRYKGLIRITNPVSQTNYQHKFTLVWLPGMRNDFRDIRFSQINGKKCDYWVESYTSRTSVVVWIEVPTAGQRWLNIFYGNGRAVSESSGENTFDFFDDFSGVTIDASKWTSAGTTTITSGSAKVGTTSNITSSLTSVATFGEGYILRAKATIANTSLSQVRLGFVNNSQDVCLWHSWSPSKYTYFVYAGNASSGSPSYVSLGAKYLTSYTYEIRRQGSGVTALYVDDVAKVTGRTGSSTSANPIFINTYDANNYSYIDWIYLRKYAAVEPTLTLVSHQPNSSRIIPYETLGEQPTGGTTYVMDPIEFGITVAASMGPTILQPVVSFAHSLAVSAPVTKLITEVDFGYTIAGSVISRNYIPLDQLDLTQISVSKAVSDDIWAMNATIDGFTELNTDVLRHATYTTTDHLGVSQSIFAGILPKSQNTIKESANKTTITGYDYAWYLSRQQVQSAYQHNTAGTNPATVITGLLGGNDWEETTGIMPYNINQVAGWGTTLNSKAFDFTTGTTKKQAIDKICAYCRFVFLVKWIVVDGIATPAAYFISEDDIDTELDLPAPVTFAYPDPYLIDDIRPVVKGDERYNRVTVIGRDNSGGVFTASVESASVTAGDELAVEFIENSGAWTTQAQVTARAAELYAYYSEVAYTYTAKLADRMDLELLQKIQITGYTGISENWMRITRIKKTIRATNNGVEKTVEIEFTENVKWSALRRMYRYSSDDMTGEIETIVKSQISQIPGPQLGTATAVDGQEATILLEDGTTITTRCI